MHIAPKEIWEQKYNGDGALYCGLAGFELVKKEQIYKS